MIASTIPDLIRERASLQPNDPAFTFVDFDKDWEGVPETLTWASCFAAPATSLTSCANTPPPAMAVILAPQSLEYIIAFVGALQAGLIAVPLSVPAPGAHDERTKAVLADTSPAVILTTSAISADLAEYTAAPEGGAAPVTLEVDKLDLDTRRGTFRAGKLPEIAYLQYTSGSTRRPAGVVLSHKNLSTNFEQLMADFFADSGKVPPAGATFVSWLPFYHDMGLMLGVIVPIMAGVRSELTTPMSFLQRPARWVQMMARNAKAVSAGPNFAFELAAGRTSDEDMAGLDLSDVVHVLSGSERVHTATVKRFTERFAKFNFPAEALRPSYGLAEAVVYVATRRVGQPPEVAYFDSEKLSAGHAKRVANEEGTPLISYGMPSSPVVRIVDPEILTECPDGATGEIWVYGDNVALGYWQKIEESEHTFAGSITNPSAGTPEGPWLRTGDLGFVSEGELFIMGRIKDLLIVYGRNHAPDDIEATVQEISHGRVAAISVPDDRTEHLVVIVEVKTHNKAPEEKAELLDGLKREITSAISTAHGLKVADLVLVGPGSIPITTSGKIRRASCVEQYRGGQFVRLDA